MPLFGGRKKLPFYFLQVDAVILMDLTLVMSLVISS